MLLNKMELNKNVMLGIVIGVISLIFLQALIANITTPKVEIVEDVNYISDPLKNITKSMNSLMTSSSENIIPMVITIS